MKYQKPVWLVAPGHGWLKVETGQIYELGVADKISRCSFFSECGRYAYLEEDCDATPFIDAYGRDKYNDEGIPLKVQHISHSYIDDLPPYDPTYVKERARFLGL